MSRIGNRAVPLPAGVRAKVEGDTVTVEGPKGTLVRRVPAELSASVEGDTLVVRRAADSTRHKALHGLTRTLLANMVEGVSREYEKRLEIVGVGYRAEARPFGLVLHLGFSRPVEVRAPPGIRLAAEQPTLVRVVGPDKEIVGQVAAEIRALRPPEPYKGKGVRYQGERVRRKAGKTGAK